MSEESYARRVTGKGPTFQERQWMRVEYPECGVEVISGSLLTHRQIQHGVGRGDRDRATPPPPHPQGGPEVHGLFTKTLIEAPVPGSGVTGWGVNPDQPPDSLCAPPRAGYNYDLGGR